MAPDGSADLFALCAEALCLLDEAAHSDPSPDRLAADA